MITGDPFDNSASDIQRELGSGEKLLWSGRPVQGFLLRPRDMLMIPFSLMWGGFAIFWESMAIKIPREHGAAPVAYIFPLWGLPFVVLGIYMIFGRFIWDVYMRKSMVYAVTNTRVIILTQFLGRSVKSLGLSTLGDIEVKEGAEGRGTITFGPQWTNRRNQPPTFDGIPNARGVYQLILKAQRESFGAA